MNDFLNSNEWQWRLARTVVQGVIGVLIDRDAAGYNLADDDLVSSPYNAKGQYYNLFNHVRIQLQNDLTEKAVVFCIGGSVNPNPPEPSGDKIFEGEVTAVEGAGGMIGGTITPDLSALGD